MRKFLPMMVPLLLVAGATRVGAQVFETNNFGGINAVIPAGDPSGLASVQTISTEITNLASVQLSLSVSGNFNGDLYGYVRHVQGGVTNFCVLLNRAGRTASNVWGYADCGFDVVFSDAAAGDVHTYRASVSPAAGSPVTGSWQPDGRSLDPRVVVDTSPRTTCLASFTNCNPNGSWTLFLASTSCGSTNTLVSWGLLLAGQRSQGLNWPAPASIAYGTALGPNQLNATAGTSGTFTYSPPAGTVLGAGTNLLSVAFQPSDTTDYASATGVVSIVVSPATLNVTANNATRGYGAANPAFTGTIVGVVNGDPITATYSCSATTNSLPGQYGIMAQLIDPDGRLANYTVTVNNGTLTVLDGYTVTASVSPAGAGEASGGGVFASGASVVLTATTNAGYQFVGWTEDGQAASALPGYSFAATADRNLVANFVPYPFVPAKGNYSGLFSDETNGVSPQSCGALTLTTTPGSGYSGSLRLAGGTYRISGTFDGTGKATKTISRGSQNPLTLSLRLELLSGAEWVGGTVGDGAWTAQLYGGRVPYDGRAKLAPQAGSYTLILPGACGSTNAPAGDSYGTVTVNKGGLVSLRCSLADGTSQTPTAALLEDGQWPVYASFDGGQGVLWGWLCFTNASDLGGSLAWIKPALRSGNYPHGFAVTAAAVGARCVPPGRGTNVLGLAASRDLTLVLTGGGLTEAITNRVALAANNGVTTLSGPRLSLSFTPSTGAFSGRAATPGGSGSVSFGGVLLLNQQMGSGFFMGQAGSGEVQLEW